MVNNSKVLTVSYGTFSCTLEGFDDSFDTMKAIAEYFRDLAADDRYFGAEPPVPDAEMLARIAEREIERRVATRFEKDSIVLTAEVPEHAEVHPAALEAAAQGTAEPEVVEEPISTAEPEVIAEPEITAGPETVSETETAPKAKAAPETERPMQEIAVEDVPEAEGTSGEDVQPEPEQIAAKDTTPEPAVETAIEEPVAEVETIAGETVEAETVDKTPADSEDDSIAAKLQRIRDVVSKSEGTMAPDHYTEDEHADPFLASVAKDIESALEVDDLNEDDQSDLDVLSDVQSETDQPTVQEKDPGRVRARVIRMKRADFNASVASGILEEDEPAVAEDTAPPEAVEQLIGNSLDTSLSPEEEAELLAELAEVEAELAGHSLDDEVDLSGENDAVPETIIEDVAEDIIEDQPDAEELQAAEPAPEPEEERVTLRRRQLPQESDTEMSRLLEKTNSQLDEPETSRRRSAIAHLRAAVAATKAEKNADADAEPDHADLPQDIAETAPRKPRRPAPDPKRRAERSATPLKLVASQRVDLEESETPEQAPQQTETAAGNRVSVRPRRISASEMAEGPTPDSRQLLFREFADSRGVSTMGEMVEAAAAFLSFELGWKGFNRQQVLKLCRGAHDDIFNREDGLRSFGQLLRSGKIEKSESGRFIASDRIGFQDQGDRQAG